MADSVDRETEQLDHGIEVAFDEAEQSLNVDLARASRRIRSLDWIPSTEGEENALVQEIVPKQLENRVCGFYTYISDSPWL